MFENLLPETTEQEFQGYAAVSPRLDDPKYAAKMKDAVDLIFNTPRMAPAKRMEYLVKAVGTADFPYLTGAIIERELIAGFQEFPETIEKIFRKATRINFNTKRAMRLDGADQQLIEIPEGGAYPEAKLTETEWEYALKLYGRILGLTLQQVVNDDLDAFVQVPAALGRGARRTRQKHMTELLMTTTGWLSALFDTTGGQTAVSTTALDASGLATGLKAMAKYTLDGSPIVVRPKYLVVAPALEEMAYTLTEPQTLHTLVTGLASTSSKSTEKVGDPNWAKKFNLEVLVDPWMPIVASTGTKGDTCWGLFCDPNDIAAAEWGTLRGMEGPQVFMKLPDQVPVGGGADPWGGSFDRDSKKYKVRDAHGGVAMAPHGRYLSNGQ